MKSQKLNSVWSKRERADIARIVRCALADEARNQPVIILVAMRQTIKGKLGFDINTHDGEFALRATLIAKALRDDKNGFYTPAFPHLSKLDAQIKELLNAAVAVKLRKLGAASKKHGAKAAVKKTLDKALNFVNQIAADRQDEAPQIITGAHMVVITYGKKNKRNISAKPGYSPGVVILTAKAAKVNGKRKRASYFWRYSIDNGVTWIDLTPSHQANTVATGMPHYVKIIFQMRHLTTINGTTKWFTAMPIVLQ